MMQKLFFLMMALNLISMGHIKAQTAEGLWHKYLTEYLEYVQDGKTDKTLKPMSECAYYATKGKLDNNMKVLTWYLYLAELLKHDPQNKDVGEYSGLICNYGSELEDKSTSYGMDLITANAYILRSAYVKPEWKPVLLIKSFFLLKRLEDEKTPPVAEKDYEGFYGLSQLSVSNDERLKMIYYISQIMEKFSGEEWYHAADVAQTNYKNYGNSLAAITCLQMSEEKDHADAWALHGYLYEIGRILPKDKTQAAQYYKRAAEKGSIRGKVEYANLLIGGKIVEQDYAQALQLLSAIENEPDFLRFGGGYHLGRLFENGWGVEPDIEKAIALYTSSFEKCIWKKTKTQSYESSKRLENKLVQKAIDQEVQSLDLKSMNCEELTAIAQRYEAVNAPERAIEYMLMAVDKGSSYSACQLGKRYYDSSNRKDMVLLQGAFKLFKKGAEGNYAPCKYNVAVMYLYGWGTSPNHEMALEYYNRYMEQIAAEGFEEYESDDYLETITGTLYYDEATKKGVPLKKVIDDFNNPSELYNWGRYRERDNRPEISIYFYTRAAQKGHPKAAERLETLKKRLQEEK